MSETIRVRMLLARMDDDTEPSVVAAIDEAIWEHWDDADEAEWIAGGKESWGAITDTEFRVVVAEFAPQDLVDAFATPKVRGTIA